MSTALAEQVSPIRILRRKALGRKSPVALSARRPSMLDPNLRGDAWILSRRDGSFALCFDCWEMASIGGLTLDLPSFNTLLQGLRRRPRRRS
jgi:hypothetical protein